MNGTHNLNPHSALRARTAAAAFALVALLAACGGGGGNGPSSTSNPPAPEEPQFKLRASAPGELTTQIQTLLRARATARQAGALGAADRASSTAAASTTSLGPAVAAATAATAATAFSTSLNQEQGVDEPDLVKTDGTHLFSLDVRDNSQPQLRIQRRTETGALEARSATTLTASPQTQITPRGFVASSDWRALAVVSDGYAGFQGDPCVDICPRTLVAAPFYLRSFVALERVDVSNVAQPARSQRLEFDGRLVDARRVGDRLIVVSQYNPLLAAEQLPATATAAERESAITATRGSNALPRLHLADGSTRPLVDETQCWLQPANASLSLEVTTITVLDLRAPDLAPSSRCFFGGTEAMALTTETLVLASTRWSYNTSSADRFEYPPQIRTDLHQFALGAEGLNYRASGEVPGHLGWDPQRKSYRISAHQGALRVLTYTGSLGWGSVPDNSTPASPATLTILREASGGVLTPVASLPNAARPQALGKPNEQVYGVRFDGTRGYLVTFRRTDPLYVLDLANETDPRVAGELEVPGFSDHLLPLPGGLLLGVGRDADATGRATGVKFSLFDVAEAARPRLVGSHLIGGTSGQSGLDLSRQGLSLLQVGGVVRLATPVNRIDANSFIPISGLQRLEVNLTARTLSAKPLLPPATSVGASYLEQQRSVLVGEQLYWLLDGSLRRHDW
jgi:Beta propeller domain